MTEHFPIKTAPIWRAAFEKVQVPMPNDIPVETWKECEAKLRDIQHTYSDRSGEVMFRGHASAEWNLDTTLERRIEGPTSFFEYYQLIARIKNSVETFTNTHWEMPCWETIREWTDAPQLSMDPNKIVLACDYVAHLRHRISFPPA